MLFESNSRLSTILGWTASVILHCGVGFLFLNIFVDISLKESEFAEVTFSSFMPAERPSIAQGRSTASAPPPQSSRASQKSRPVDLPVRKQQETELPRLLEDKGDKVDVTTKSLKTGERENPLSGLSMESQVRPGSKVPGEKELREPPRRIDVGDKISTEIPTEGIGGNIISQKPFNYEIQWESGTREILAVPLPVIPENINREVMLRMQISVLPDGTMGEIIPLQKGNATLENITIQALKKWMFYPLEENAPQVNQKGIVIFRFVLK